MQCYFLLWIHEQLDNFNKEYQRIVQTVQVRNLNLVNSTIRI